MNNWDLPLAKLEFDKVRHRIFRYASSDPGRSAVNDIRVLTSPHAIRQELARVSEVKRLLEQEEPLPLDGVYAVQEALGKSAVDGMTLLPHELLHVALTLKAARLVRTFALRRRQEYPRIGEIAEELFSDKVLEFNIDQAIDETGAVRESASRELLTIRRAIADRYEELRKRLAGILRNVAELGFTQDDIITTREGRMVIPVKSEHKNRVPGFIHSASSSGATVFIEPTETLELNNDIRGLQFDEQREVQRILKALTTQVGEHKDSLKANLPILATLDALQAKAKYSIEILGMEPVLNDDGPVRLVQARHPLLLTMHGRKETVPLDLELGETSVTLLISGPNAGGKSVALKCVGLLVVMTQAGLHIPAGEGTMLRVFRSCYVDIGDEQSIENDLSTFSSHLANLKTIESEADNGSLVLIDEIGAGTDPAEGGAIAAALLEELTGRGALTIATTHQGALKVFAHETPGVMNGAMEFNQESLTPTYRFRAGIPGSSYALEMASRLGFAPSFMERSRAILGSQHSKMDTLLIELEAAAQAARKELESVNSEKVRLKTLVREHEEKVGKLSTEIRELKKQAIDEAGAIVKGANALIEKSIKEIREHHAEKGTVHRIRTEVETVRHDLEEQQRETEPPSAPGKSIEVGSPVTLGDGTDTGEVEKISADRKSAVVIFGSVKMRVPLAELRLGRRRARAMEGSGSIPDIERSPEELRDLDLRGMTGDQALPLIDKLIDSAMLSGLHRIDVIHGMGTGALRKKVVEFLSTHPRVKSFRMGERHEGGSGVTIVELVDE